MVVDVYKNVMDEIYEFFLILSLARISESKKTYLTCDGKTVGTIYTFDYTSHMLHASKQCSNFCWGQVR